MKSRRRDKKDGPYHPVTVSVDHALWLELQELPRWVNISSLVSEVLHGIVEKDLRRAAGFLKTYEGMMLLGQWLRRGRELKRGVSG